MKALIYLLMLTFPVFGNAQQTLILWDFNSNPADGSLSTGSLEPQISTGRLNAIGSVETSFASAESNGGSGDTVFSDNSGLNTNHYPTQAHNDRSSGIQFECSTYGFQNLALEFDLRATSTASKYLAIQFSTDSGASWIEASIYMFAVSASSWDNNIQIDLKQFEELNDQPNTWFRLVSCFEPGTDKYKAVGNSSNYSAAGSFRFDRLRITGEPSLLFQDITPPTVTIVTPINRQRIEIHFSEPISGFAPGQFSGIPGEFELTESDSNRIVQLYFQDGFPQGVHHQLNICCLIDTAGNEMSDNQSFSVFLNSSKPDIKITEIMYNPPGDDDLEYVEIYNNGNDSIPMEAFFFQGIELNLAECWIAPKSFMLFAKYASLCEQVFHRKFVNWESGSLTNSGEAIVLRNQLGEAIDSVFYDNTGNWPKEPNGNGTSLERIEPFDNNIENWRSSFAISGRNNNKTLYGSPGSGYSKNRVSFKTDTLWVSEGLGEFKLPVLLKTIDNEAVWIKVSASENEDLIIDQNVIRLLKDQDNELTIQLTNDQQFEETEFMTISIVDQCNSWLSGFSTLTVAITDNDNVLPVLCISEWMPQNSKTVPDEHGDFRPWIELYNPFAYPVDLSLYSLKTCNTTNDSCEQSSLPPLLLQPESFMLFYTDSESWKGAQHLNIFLPKKNGEISLLSTEQEVKLSTRTYATSYSNKSTEALEPCSDSVFTNSHPTPGGMGLLNTISEVRVKQFNIEPNPFTGKVIDLPEKDDYFLYDNRGILISTCHQQNKLQVQDLCPGMYSIRSLNGLYAGFVIP